MLVPFFIKFVCISDVNAENSVECKYNTEKGVESVNKLNTETPTQTLPDKRG